MQNFLTYFATDDKISVKGVKGTCGNVQSAEKHVKAKDVLSAELKT